MDEFAGLWNSPANVSSQSRLANTGKVLFAIIQNEKIIRVAIVLWDKEGKAHNIRELSNNNNNIPSFFAPVGVWESVIYSYYTPLQAVVSKKMEFQGPMLFATKFSQRFSIIADVAITVNRIFMKI